MHATFANVASISLVFSQTSSRQQLVKLMLVVAGPVEPSTKDGCV